MTTNKHTQQTILVLNGTGKTGRRVADRLSTRGLTTRVGSRSGAPAFDWDDEATWRPALQDVGAVYLSYYPDLALPQAADAVRSFSALAVEAGVRRLVLLSGRGEEGALRAEQAVRDSGAEWTVVRCSWFSQNFSESFLLDPILAGEVAVPVGDVGEPFVDAEDIADVAVAALTEEGHAGRVYELTGPRLLTFAEAVAEIGEAAGRDIACVQVGLDDYLAALTEVGVPADIRWLMRYLFAEVLDGRNASLADGVQRALGRPPRDFHDFAAATAAAGVWAAGVSLPTR